MGRRKAEILKGKQRVYEALQELNQMLQDVAHTDGRPTEIYIRVKGTYEESMRVELEDLSEVLEILRLNS